MKMRRMNGANADGTKHVMKMRRIIGTMLSQSPDD